MKKLAIRFTILVICLLCTDIVIGKILDKTFDYMPNTTSQTAHTNWFMNHASADVIILGSSRATHHYIPSIISDSLDMSVYNCGHEGMDIIYNSCCLERIISRHLPKLVILDIQEPYFHGTEKQRLACLSPYYYKSDYIKNVLDTYKGSDYNIKMKSNLYRYNGKLLNILSAFTASRDKNIGYVPLNGNKVSKMERQDTDTRLSIDDAEKQSFINIVQMCKENNIKLIVIDSPRFMFDKYEFEYTRNLCQQYDVPYIMDNNVKEIIDHPEYFRDPTHLNNDGATEYSKMVSHQIKEIIN